MRACNCDYVRKGGERKTERKLIGERVRDCDSVQKGGRE